MAKRKLEPVNTKKTRKGNKPGRRAAAGHGVSKEVTKCQNKKGRPLKIRVSATSNLQYAANPDCESAEDLLQPLQKDGDTVLEVECGTNKAHLYLSKLCQGSKGSCIEYDGSWLTPNEFQAASGRESAKDWKRSIRHYEKSLKLLLAKGAISLHSNSCDCDGNTIPRKRQEKCRLKVKRTKAIFRRKKLKVVDQNIPKKRSSKPVMKQRIEIILPKKRDSKNRENAKPLKKSPKRAYTKSIVNCVDLNDKYSITSVENGKIVIACDKSGSFASRKGDHMSAENGIVMNGNDATNVKGRHQRRCYGRRRYRDENRVDKSTENESKNEIVDNDEQRLYIIGHKQIPADGVKTEVNVECAMAVMPEEHDDISIKMKIYDFSDEIEPFRMKCHLDSKGLGIMKGNGATFTRCIADEEINEARYRQGQNEGDLEKDIKTDIIRANDGLHDDTREKVMDNKGLSDYEDEEMGHINDHFMENSENCDNIVDAIREIHEKHTGNDSTNENDNDNNDDCDAESEMKDDSDDDDTNDDTSNDVGWTELSQCESALGDMTCDIVEEETMDYSTSLDIDDDYDDIQEVPNDQSNDINNGDDYVELDETLGRKKVDGEKSQGLDNNTSLVITLNPDIKCALKCDEKDTLTTNMESAEDNDMLSTNICLRLECSTGIEDETIEEASDDKCEDDGAEAVDNTGNQELVHPLMWDATTPIPEIDGTIPVCPMRESPKIPSGGGSNREDRLNTIIAQLRERTTRRLSPSMAVSCEHRTPQDDHPQNQYPDEKSEHCVSNDQEPLLLDGASLNENSCDCIRSEADCVSGDDGKQAIKCHRHDASASPPLTGISMTIRSKEPCNPSAQSADPIDNGINKLCVLSDPDMNDVIGPSNEKRPSGNGVDDIVITQITSVDGQSYTCEDNSGVVDMLSAAKPTNTPGHYSPFQAETAPFIKEDSPVFANTHKEIMNNPDEERGTIYGKCVEQTSTFDILNKLIELGSETILEKDHVTDDEEDASEYIDVVDSMSGGINVPIEKSPPQPKKALCMENPHTMKIIQPETVDSNDAGGFKDTNRKDISESKVKTSEFDAKPQDKTPEDRVMSMESLDAMDDSVSDDNPLVIDFRDSEANEIDTMKKSNDETQRDDSQVNTFNEQPDDLTSGIADKPEKQATHGRKQKSTDIQSASGSHSAGHCIKRLTGRRKHKLTDHYNHSTDIQVQQIVSEIKRSVESALSASEATGAETLATTKVTEKQSDGEQELLHNQYRQLQEKNKSEAKFQAAEIQQYRPPVFTKDTPLNRQQTVAAVRPRKKAAVVDKMNSPSMPSTTSVSSHSHMHLPPGVSYAMPIATGASEQLAALRGEQAKYTEYMNALAASNYQYQYMMPQMYRQTGSTELSQAYGMNGMTSYPYSTLPYYLPQMMPSQFYPTPHLSSVPMSQSIGTTPPITATSLLSSLSSILSPSKTTNTNRPYGGVPVPRHRSSNTSASGNLKRSRQQQSTVADYLTNQSAKRKNTDNALDLSVKKTKLDCGASPAADVNHLRESGQRRPHPQHKHNCGANCEGHSLETESPVKKQSQWTSQSSRVPSVSGCQCKQLNPLANWTCDEVCTFLCALDGCAIYAQRFQKQGVNGQVLPRLTVDHLIHNFGMNIGPAIMLSRTVAKLMVLTSSSGCEKCLGKNHDTRGTSVYKGSRLFASGK